MSVQVLSYDWEACRTWVKGGTIDTYTVTMDVINCGVSERWVAEELDINSLKELCTEFGIQVFV